MFTIFAFIWILLISVIGIFYNVVNGNWNNVVIVVLVDILIASIWTFLLLYYRNIVIAVSFDGDNTVIKTNCRVYVLPSKNFYEINDSVSSGRTYLLYSDGTNNKRFIFQKQYSPFKKYSLNIKEMRVHMTSAVFKNT